MVEVLGAGLSLHGLIVKLGQVIVNRLILNHQPRTSPLNPQLSTLNRLEKSPQRGRDIAARGKATCGAAGRRHPG